ncbi:hypothetical protein [Paracoccus aestuariivivens]|uniref:Uncharacterized protein n=1 Tax=Paracoccus aestuariivivens TaxID=1820333 RepID=A0A6L6J2F1_9RHOB|nr:hypothetical protein [Paracoccus aestuariivivens]MTH76303.1 hypothetical protein [Paracoccus aestuariivivens]
MAQIIGTGDPVNPALATYFDSTIDFSGLGLTDRFEFKAPSIVRGDVSGTQRVSQINPIGTSRPLTQGVPASQPAYLAGGGPGGLTDALEFVKTRPDQMALGELAIGKLTKVLIIRPTITDAAVNQHLLSARSTGTGRNTWILRQTSGQLGMYAWVGDVSPNWGNAEIPAGGIPLDTWQAVAMCLDPDTRTVKCGVRATGAASWTWATAVWPVPYPPTQTLMTLGAHNALGTADSYSGRMAGALTFVGHDAHAEPALLDQINAWAFGSGSIFGL